MIKKLALSAAAVVAVIGAIYLLPSAVSRDSPPRNQADQSAPGALTSRSAPAGAPDGSGLVMVPGLQTRSSDAAARTAGTSPAAQSLPIPATTSSTTPSRIPPSAATSLTSSAATSTAVATTTRPPPVPSLTTAIPTAITTAIPVTTPPPPPSTAASPRHAPQATTPPAPAAVAAPATTGSPRPATTQAPAPKPTATPVPVPRPTSPPAPKPPVPPKPAPKPTPPPAPHFGIPVTVGNATQIITVAAPTRSSTTGTLIAWQKLSNGSWKQQFGPVTAHLGSDGVGAPSEYNSHTPQGTWAISQAFGRNSNPGTSLPYTHVDGNDWWVSDVKSPAYNTLQVCGPQDCPFDTGAGENLYNAGSVYDYAVVMDVNRWPATPGAGSAYFLHVTDGTPTAGCVSIDPGTLVSIMQWLKPAGHPRIAVDIG